MTVVVVEINYPMLMFLICMGLTAVSFYFLSITFQDSKIVTVDNVISNQTIVINGNATNQVVLESLKTTEFNNPMGFALSIFTFVVSFSGIIVFGTVANDNRNKNRNKNYNSVNEDYDYDDYYNSPL